MKLNIFRRIFGKKHIETTPEATTPDTTQAETEPQKTPGTDGSGDQDTPTLKEAFTAKYPDWVFILTAFEAANLCAATWDNLTKARLQKFIAYMAERHAPNTVNQYATRLKAVLNMYADEVELPRGYSKVLTPRRCVTTSVYLTEEELDRIASYIPRTQRELYVRNTFLLAAYTGARHSDAERFNESNINGDTLQYVSQKTKTPVTLPLKPIVAELIRENVRVDMTDKTYNSNLRRICQKCLINQPTKVFKAGAEAEGEKWEYVGSHTARRSFASNLYLRGVDIYTISRLLGHSDVRITQQYIQSGVRTDSEELMGYFK